MTYKTIKIQKERFKTSSIVDYSKKTTPNKIFYSVRLHRVCGYEYSCFAISKIKFKEVKRKVTKLNDKSK